jgi:Skp family chaperone for outer membrane proteins
MKVIKYLTLIAAIAMFQTANAYTSSSAEKINQEIEQKSLQEAQRYADKTGKKVPQAVDYKYGMNLDIANVVYMTPNVNYCGNISKLMTYEDSQGDLNTVRYLTQGVCRNNK